MLEFFHFAVVVVVFFAAQKFVYFSLIFFGLFLYLTSTAEMQDYVCSDNNKCTFVACEA